MERFAKYSHFYSIDFFIFTQNIQNRKRKQPIERKMGVTERPRSLNVHKVKAMAICPIIVHFTTRRVRSMHDVAWEFRAQ